MPDDIPRPVSNLKKWAFLALKLLVVLVVLWALRRTLLDGFEQLRGRQWSFDPFWLVASGLFYVLGLLPAGLFWRHILRRMGQDARLGETLRAYYIGHLGKYVPGKAMVVILRTGLIRSHRVSTPLAAVSVFFETLTMMAVGAFVAALILAVAFQDQLLLCALAFGLAVASALPTLPPVFRQILRLTRVGKRHPEIADQIEQFDLTTLLRGWIAMFVAWILLGVSFWAVLQSMGIPGPSLLRSLPGYVASVSLATVAGFLSLIPGGAFVREAILTGITGPSLGEGVALVAAVVLRLVWLVSEMVISGMLYWFGRPRGE